MFWAASSSMRIGRRGTSAPVNPGAIANDLFSTGLTYAPADHFSRDFLANAVGDAIHLHDDRIAVPQGAASPWTLIRRSSGSAARATSAR